MHRELPFPGIDMKTNAPRQRDAALKLLDQAGVWRSNAAPPLFRQLWRIGIDIPPPHFLPFAASALLFGVMFGILLSLMLYVLHPLFGNAFPAPTLLKAIVGGLFVGLWMAAYHAYGRSKYELPRWSSLPHGNDS